MITELPGRTLIRYPFPIWAVMTSAMVMLVTVMIFLKDRNPVMFLSLLYVVRLLGDMRRKIVIGDDEITYWPPIGSPKKMRFAEIASVSSKTVGVVYAGNPWPKPGVELTLTNGMPAQIPLDLPEREEVLDRITKAWQRNREMHSL